jgi:hypothetical protein
MSDIPDDLVGGARRLAQGSGLPAETLLQEASFAAEPALALARVADLADGAAALASLDGDERRALFVLLGGSGHLSRVLRSLPGWANWIRRAVGDEIARPTLDTTALLAVGAAASLATTFLDDPTSYGRIVRDDKGNFKEIVEHRDCSPEQLKINEVNPSYYCFDAKTLFGVLVFPQIKKGLRLQVETHGLVGVGGVRVKYGAKDSVRQKLSAILIARRAQSGAIRGHRVGRPV